MKKNIKRDSAIDLFNGILKTARDAGALQELDRIIDYDSACEFEEKNKRPISNYEFATEFRVDFGGSEGIYIDAWLDGYLDESGHTQRLHFGTIKTLERDLAAMKIMGEACGILQYYASDYLNKNLSRYEPDPTKLSLFHNSDTPFWCRSCKSMGNIAVLKRLAHGMSRWSNMPSAANFAVWKPIISSPPPSCAKPGTTENTGLGKVTRSWSNVTLCNPFVNCEVRSPAISTVPNARIKSSGSCAIRYKVWLSNNISS